MSQAAAGDLLPAALWVPVMPSGGGGGLRSCNINARVEVREYKSECGFRQRGTPRACFNDCDGGHETKPGLVCRKRRIVRGKSPFSQTTKAI